MALPGLVLVQGGGLAADSWELTIDEIARLETDLTVLAVVEIDTCHDLMVSEPKRLAEILIERCRLYE